MTSDVEYVPPTLPKDRYRHSVTKTIKMSQQLLEAYLEVMDYQATPDVLERLADLTGDVLGSSYHLETLRESVSLLAGDMLTEDLLRKLARRIAGNMHRLKLRVAAVPWRMQPFDEWCPVQVTSVRPGRNRRSKRCWFMTLRVLAGCPASEEISHRYTWDAADVLSPRWGFSDAYGDLPLHDGTEFVGLRNFVFIPRGYTAEDYTRLEFADLREDYGSVLAFNRRLLRARNRNSSQFTCPFNLSTSLLCHQCSAGWDVCEAAVRPKTLVEKRCRNCKKLGPCDPDARGGWCVNCVRREALKPRRS